MSSSAVKLKLLDSLTDNFLRVGKEINEISKKLTEIQKNFNESNTNLPALSDSINDNLVNCLRDYVVNYKKQGEEKARTYEKVKIAKRSIDSPANTETNNVKEDDKTIIKRDSNKNNAPDPSRILIAKIVKEEVPVDKFKDQIKAQNQNVPNIHPSEKEMIDKSKDKPVNKVYPPQKSPLDEKKQDAVNEPDNKKSFNELKAKFSDSGNKNLPNRPSLLKNQNVADNGQPGEGLVKTYVGNPVRPSINQGKDIKELGKTETISNEKKNSIDEGKITNNGIRPATIQNNIQNPFKSPVQNPIPGGERKLCENQIEKPISLNPINEQPQSTQKTPDNKSGDNQKTNEKADFKKNLNNLFGNPGGNRKVVSLSNKPLNPKGDDPITIENEMMMERAVNSTKKNEENREI